MIATIIICIIIGIWMLYVGYRRFFDKTHPIGSCGGSCYDCHSELCHLDLVKEYRRDQARQKTETL